MKPLSNPSRPTLKRSMLFATMIAAGLIATPAGAAELKLTKVSLFSSGVGYYQCDNTVSGIDTVELHFRTEQINDILKSLILQDFDGGRIEAVQYPARDPISKTLKSFAVDISGKTSMADLFSSLRGVEVEIPQPHSIRGLVFGVETKKDMQDGKVVESQLLSIMTDAGLRTVPLHEVGGVKILDPKLEAELKKALLTLASAHDADKKTVTLRFSGDGTRRVRASYILEAPIWKTSYRLVLGDKEHPFFLQGWANVENTTEQDWENVQLSLVSGRPVSFTMDLYSPIYLQRPQEALELYAGLRATRYEGAMDDAGEDKRTVNVPTFKGRGIGLPRAAAGRAAGRERADAMLVPGEAGNLFGGGGNNEAYALEYVASNRMGLSESGAAAMASGERAGELFKYEIQSPVSLKRQHSAMLPIVTAKLAAKKLSIFSAATHPRHPFNGIELENTTDVNLMQGPITIFDGNTYAGDAKLPDLRPGEKRLLSYALDLGVEVEQKSQPRIGDVLNVRIARGVIWRKQKFVDRVEYLVKNKDSEDKTVLVEHPLPEGWTLVEPAEPHEKAPGVVRLKVTAVAGKTQTLPVVIERVTDETVTLMGSDSDQIAIFIKQYKLSDAVRRAMEEVIARQTAIRAVAREREEAEHGIRAIESEQSRIRENMKAMPKESDIFRRYLTKLDAQETELEKLREKITGLREQESKLQTALEEFLLQLTVE
ncbi:hypothetical protein RAS2_19490 [Phycisphaerae bacterium RAS2]|nr:hypothetical protein RAS2_19490 [Phycisphaerae bacterium RAS2]